jgi:hypothetical protein
MAYDTIEESDGYFHNRTLSSIPAAQSDGNAHAAPRSRVHLQAPSAPLDHATASPNAAIGQRGISGGHRYCVDVPRPSTPPLTAHVANSIARLRRLLEQGAEARASRCCDADRSTLRW